MALEFNISTEDSPSRFDRGSLLTTITNNENNWKKEQAENRVAHPYGELTTPQWIEVLKGALNLLIKAERKG